jgi:DNA-binding transcriptional LysR family regulator
LDIALVAGQPQDKELRGRLLMRDRLVAVMSPRHRLADREVLQVQQLASEPLIVLTATSELRERVAVTFQRFRARLNVQVETGTLESIKKMAARNMGVGIVPRMCVQGEEASGDLVVKTIDEFREERMLWMVCRRTTLSPACHTFMKIIKAEVKAVSKVDLTRVPGVPLSRHKRRRRSRR